MARSFSSYKFLTYLLFVLLIYLYFCFIYFFNYFEPKFFKSVINKFKCSTAFGFRTLMLLYATRAHLFFQMTRNRVTIFRAKTTIVSCLHVMLLICKVFINHFSKSQSVVFLFACADDKKFGSSI